MSYNWVRESDLEINLSQPVGTPHPALEPVSAWLFREDSSFLEAGGLPEPSTALVAMAMDRSGFDPDSDHAFRAREVTTSADRPLEGHLFGVGYIRAFLPIASATMPDPRVFVLPLAADSVRPDEELQRRTELGPPPDMPDTCAVRRRHRRPRAVIGIIDHAINIFHHRFRSGTSGSRIANAWFQGATVKGHLPFGAEWTRHEIEAAQAEAGEDEDTLLRRIGAGFGRPGFRPLARRTGHGTHVLDLAAGMDPEDRRGERFPIIAVTLPPEVTRETTGSMLALPYALGLEYILDRARRLMPAHRRPPQVFVNVSFGLSGGPREGMHVLEQTVHRLGARHMRLSGARRPPVVVTAAGNRNLAQGHARNAPGSDSLSVGWHVQPGDTSSNFLELRIGAPPGIVREIALDLTPPDGAEQISTRIEVDTTLESSGAQLLFRDRTLTRPGTIVGRASARLATVDATILTLALAPTDPGPGAGTTAAPGDWQITVRTPDLVPERIDAFVLRDDVPHGFRDTGRQSYLTDSGFRRHDLQGRQLADDPEDGAGVVRRAGTLNALATGPKQRRKNRSIWVVGGMVGGDSHAQPTAAAYSATPLDGGTERVDCSAPSDRSDVLQGILGAGIQSGIRVPIAGTSVAAPQVLRHLAIGTGKLRKIPKPDRSPRLGKSILQRKPGK